MFAKIGGQIANIQAPLRRAVIGVSNRPWCRSAVSLVPCSVRLEELGVGAPFIVVEAEQQGATGLGIILLQPQCLAKSGDSLRELALASECSAEIAMRGGVIGINAQSHPIGCDRGFVLALVIECSAEEAMSLGIVGVDP